MKHVWHWWKQHGTMQRLRTVGHCPAPVLVEQTEDQRQLLGRRDGPENLCEGGPGPGFWKEAAGPYFRSFLYYITLSTEVFFYFYIFIILFYFQNFFFIFIFLYFSLFPENPHSQRDSITPPRWDLPQQASNKETGGSKRPCNKAPTERGLGRTALGRFHYALRPFCNIGIPHPG